jgi:hypothetical protein
MNRKKLILTIVLISLSIYVALNYVVYIKSSTACAKFTNQGQIKGANYLLYEFKIANKKYTGNESASKIIDISVDSLKKIKCVKVEYSNLIPFFNRVVDKRVLKQ